MLTNPVPRRSATSVALSDPLEDALGFATLAVDGQACVLDLAPQRGAPEGIIVGNGMTQADAQRLIRWLRGVLDAQPKGACVTFPLPPEQWPPSVRRIGGKHDGEAVAMHLADTTGSIGWIAFIGINGMSTRYPLAQPRTQVAFAGQLAVQARTSLEARAVREQRDQLESVFRFSGDGILTVDATLRVTGCNPALEALTGWRVSELLGTFYYDVLRSEDLEGEPLGLTRCPLLEAFATGTAVTREIVIHARDGEPIDVAITASAVLSPEGKPISGVFTVRDVTRTRENETLSSTIVSVVSHELQTPIAIIKGYASTLSRPDAVWSGDALRQRLRAIEEEADRLSHMVANLLYASRIQAGGLSMHPATIEINDLLASSVRRSQARDTRYELRLHLPENLPTVNADYERIEEVVANLLDNAMKYSRPNSMITIEGRCNNDYVTVTVSDHGAGIPLRDQQRVFDRFQRVEGDLTRKTNGAGLGLYICQAIIQAHGGQIWVESEVGHGSAFSFSLPRTERAALPMVTLPSRTPDR